MHPHTRLATWLVWRISFSSHQGLFPVHLTADRHLQISSILSKVKVRKTWNRIESLIWLLTTRCLYPSMKAWSPSWFSRWTLRASIRYERESVAEMPGRLLRTCKIALWSGGSSKSSLSSEAISAALSRSAYDCTYCPPCGCYPTTAWLPCAPADGPTCALWLDCWTTLRFLI